MPDDPKDKVWETSDGRLIPLEEMYRPHIGNAYLRIKDWAKGERDPEKRRELRSWCKAFRKELRERERAWQERRKK